MEYAAFRCQICGTKDNTLHIHHSYYTKGKEPWQYPDGSLICICEKCHESIHGKPKNKTAEPHSDPPTEDSPEIIQWRQQKLQDIREQLKRMK